MSSSFRDRFVSLRSSRRIAALAALLSVAPAAWSQQWLFMPGIETSGEYSTNRRLSTTDEESTSGGRVTLDARIRRISPRGDTELRPAISYQRFSGQSEIDALEGRFDIRHKYQTLKGRFGLQGRFRRQDAFNAELGQASFDDSDPTIPDDVGSGVVTGGVTRTSYQVMPSFSYSFTERTDFETTLRYDAVDYDSELEGERVGYKSPSIDVELVRELSPRLRIGFGPYFSHYERDDGINESDSYGATINLRFKTSEVTRSTFRVRAERNEDIVNEPVRVKDSATAWGVEWIGTRENRAGSTTYRIGRFLQPTSFGGRREVDQLHVQYDRPFNRRTSLRAAVRYTRANEISDLDVGGGDRNQARADIMLRHFFTESFFLMGGYRFAWVDRDTTGNADNHSVLLTIGLRERDPTGGWRQ